MSGAQRHRAGADQVVQPDGQGVLAVGHVGADRHWPQVRGAVIPADLDRYGVVQPEPVLRRRVGQPVAQEGLLPVGVGGQRHCPQVRRRAQLGGSRPRIDGTGRQDPVGPHHALLVGTQQPARRRLAGRPRVVRGRTCADGRCKQCQTSRHRSHASQQRPDPPTGGTSTKTWNRTPRARGRCRALFKSRCGDQVTDARPVLPSNQLQFQFPRRF